MHTCEVDPRHTPSLSLKSTRNSGRCQSLWKISRHKKILKRCSSRCQQQRTKISRHGNRRVKLFLHEPERWFIEMFSFKNGILICSAVCFPILLSSAYGCRRLPCQIESSTRGFFFFDCEKHTFLNPSKKRMKMKILRSKNTQLFISLFQKNNGGLLQSY